MAGRSAEGKQRKDHRVTQQRQWVVLAGHQHQSSHKIYPLRANWSDVRTSYQPYLLINIVGLVSTLLILPTYDSEVGVSASLRAISYLSHENNLSSAETVIVGVGENLHFLCEHLSYIILQIHVAQLVPQSLGNSTLNLLLSLVIRYG